MAKKNFFSSFEKNLSFENGATSDVAEIKERASSVQTVPSPISMPETNKEVLKQSSVNKNKPVVKKELKKVKTGEKKTPITKVTTFRIDADLLENIKAMAYWDREKIQDVLDKALSAYIDQVPASELSKAQKAYAKSLK